MSFYDTVTRAKSLFREQGRVSVAGLMREFGIDETGVDELIEELVDVQQVAVRSGNVLLWAGDTTTADTIARAAGPKVDPRSYTPKHLADKILQSKSALEGVDRCHSDPDQHPPSV